MVDAVLFEKWKKAIPRADRELSLNDHVCALHFNETDIDTHYEVKLSDGTIWREERRNHILKKGAVPCRFPNLPHYLSNPRKKRKSPIKREPLQVREMNLDLDLPFPPVMGAVKEFIKSLNEIDVTDSHQVIPFFQQGLKVSMKCDGTGVKVLKNLSLLVVNSKCLPTQKLYDLVFGHSNFFNILLTDVKDDGGLKEGVIDILIALAKHDGSVCKEQHIGIYLAAYYGTMSYTDQKLLYLIKVYSDNGVNMIKYRPFLWGKAAISHYQSADKIHKLSINQLVTSLIEPIKIENTILHYPLKMTLQPSQEVWEDFNKDLAHNIYDLRFFLPLISNLLSPGSFVKINCFIDSKLLLLVFVSLSSFDSNIRALGYHCLSQFYNHLESWRSSEKEIWISLLDCLRNDLSFPNTKLPCIITIFLARISEIFNKPRDLLYPILYKFICIKPAFDVTNVPEFYKLFNSVDLEHQKQRLWLLKLLNDGLRTSVDFHICEKRYVFSTLLSFCLSSLSSMQEKFLHRPYLNDVLPKFGFPLINHIEPGLPKRTVSFSHSSTSNPLNKTTIATFHYRSLDWKVSVLHIVLAAMKIESSARTLYRNGLLLWLHFFLEQCEINEEISEIIAQILDYSEEAGGNYSLKLIEKLKRHLKASLQLEKS